MQNFNVEARVTRRANYRICNSILVCKKWILREVCQEYVVKMLLLGRKKISWNVSGREKTNHGEVSCIFSYYIYLYTIIRVHSAFSLVASCVLLKYTRTDDVN